MHNTSATQHELRSRGSPWGGGVWLSVDGRAAEWLATSLCIAVWDGLHYNVETIHQGGEDDNQINIIELCMWLDGKLVK